MTVCIAAICRDGTEKKIVLCTDHRVGSALGSAETALKEHYIGSQWRLLTSGSEADINAMTRLYRKRFFNDDNVTAENIDESVKWPLFERKRQLCDEYTRTKYALAYEEFLKSGKDRLPVDIFRDAMVRISSIEMNTELIVAGFIDDSPEIYHCDRYGKARAFDEFQVIGEGEYLASSALYRRAQDWMTPLHRTIYNVFEAKKYSESVGSVGKQTSIAVFTKDGESTNISSEMHKELSKLYDLYGPKKLPARFSLESPLFD